jgi:predicted nucleic acid-binding protein
MNDKAFLDTNVLIYLYSTDEPDKQAAVEQLTQNNAITLSTQIINEFINVMTKKYKLEVVSITNAVREIMDSFMIVQVTTDTIMQALSIMKKYRFSYFDSLIMASALESECSVLHTEDLHHQQLIEHRLRVNNPFK